MDETSNTKTNKEMLSEAYLQLKSREWYKQIPNLLTASRLFAPLVIVPAVLLQNFSVALGASALFALTDLFDGMLARKLDAHSELGRKLDASTDKLFASSLLGVLSFTNPLILMNLGLEIVIGGVNLLSEKHGNNPKTIYLGKFKTFMLGLTICAGFAEPVWDIPRIISNVLISTTAVSQLAVAGLYYKKFVQAEYKKKIQMALKESETLEEVEEELSKTRSLEEITKEINSLKDIKHIAEKEIQHTEKIKEKKK